MELGHTLRSLMGHMLRPFSSGEEDLFCSELGVRESLTVESSAFANGEAIPARYSYEGGNVSPPFHWGRAPVGAIEWFLICEDPDAPMPSPFIHWVLCNIPITLNGVEEGTIPRGVKEGRNSFGNFGYGGPLPPVGHGTHHYHFQVFALRNHVPLQSDASRKDMINALKDQVIGYGRIVGTFER